MRGNRLYIAVFHCSSFGEPCGLPVRSRRCRSVSPLRNCLKAICARRFGSGCWLAGCMYGASCLFFFTVPSFPFFYTGRLCNTAHCPLPLCNTAHCHTEQCVNPERCVHAEKRGATACGQGTGRLFSTACRGRGSGAFLCRSACASRLLSYDIRDDTAHCVAVVNSLRLGSARRDPWRGETTEAASFGWLLPRRELLVCATKVCEKMYFVWYLLHHVVTNKLRGHFLYSGAANA